jgi:hypothetical protein
MLIKNLFDWLRAIFKKRERRFKYEVVSELPAAPFEETLYLEGNKKEKDYWYALLKCPCGCGDNIVLNLMNDAKPCWRVNINKSRPSVFPSIWRTKNCKSHFWLKNGKVSFC